MSLLPYHKGNKTNFINLLFTLTHFIRIHHSCHDTKPLPRFKIGHIVKKITYLCKICVQVSGRCYSRLQTKTSPNCRARNFIAYGKGQYAGIVPLV